LLHPSDDGVIGVLNLVEKIIKTEDEWKKQLTSEQYRVTRKKDTEMPFTGEYLDSEEKGMYKCVCCGNILFKSDDKFDSGTGWPSFTRPANDSNIEEHTDTSHFMNRVEVTCNKCGAHLGHVFNDGPDVTGMRYCINSCSLKLEEKGT
jgi:peptide-methionine (R)-S-oxide reductase